MANKIKYYSLKNILKKNAQYNIIIGQRSNSKTYAVKKMLNACYGMTLTDIVRSEIIYADDCAEEEPNLKTAIEKYNSSKSRFLFYPWGVWTTACARTAVWSAIFNLKDDYIYCDTDSVKFRRKYGKQN